jgi:hypothetical protein
MIWTVSAAWPFEDVATIVIRCKPLSPLPGHVDWMCEASVYVPVAAGAAPSQYSTLVIVAE